MRTSDKTILKAYDDYRVSEHVLEMFEKKYSKHFPKKKYLNCEEPYLDRKETFKDELFNGFLMKTHGKRIIQKNTH